MGGTTDYHHEAFRIELPLRSQAPALYKRMCGVIHWADALVWKTMKRTLRRFKKKVVYPEFEYIVYDARNGTYGTFDMHVDNDSLVTMIILLSDSKDFEGGLNYFSSIGLTN